QDGPRDRALRRRPRPAAAVRARACARGARGAAVDPGRRRARLGACAQRELRGGAPLLEALAAARHAGRAPLLPSRLRRVLPRPARGSNAVVSARARAQPALLDPLGACREKGSVVKRLVVLVVALAALAAPAAALAHP